MEKIAFIVDRLNAPPFSKGYSTMAEFDNINGFDLFNILCSIIVEIDAEQEAIYKEPSEFQIQRIIHFLNIMKYSNSMMNDIEEFQGLLTIGDKNILNDIIYWLLSKYDTLQKRAYLAKYLLPIDIPPEFMNDDLTNDLVNSLKELQLDFKEIHKATDQATTGNTSTNTLFHYLFVYVYILKILYHIYFRL